MFQWTITTSSPAWRLAALGYLRYYIDCEEYDRRVCTGPKDPHGDVLPGSGWEAGLINRHAARRWRDIPHVPYLGEATERSARDWARGLRTQGQRLEALAALEQEIA